MKQFGMIYRFELIQHLKNKLLVGITLFMMVAVAVGMFIPRFSAAEEADGAAGNAPTMAIIVKTDSASDTALLQERMQAKFPFAQVLVSHEDEETLRKTVAEKEGVCAFSVHLPQNGNPQELSFTYYTRIEDPYDPLPAQAQQVIREFYFATYLMEKYEIPYPHSAEVLDSIVVSGSVQAVGGVETAGFGYTYLMLMALYMVIILYGQMVASNVASEKSSRAMELLITSAKPESLMFGKVLATCTAGLLQLAAVFGTALACYRINQPYMDSDSILTMFFDIPPHLVGYMLMFFVLGFLIYAFLFGAVGSTVSKVEDLNAVSMPIMLIFVVGFMAVIPAISTGELDTLTIKVLSFVPFTSSMAMFARVAMTEVPWYEQTLSVLILIASSAAVGYLAAKIYRVGVLLYGKAPKLTEILRAVRKA